MRIVAGRHRGRSLAAPPGAEIRPTSDRAREAVFNILAHGGFGAGGASIVVSAIVLDVFCGTGALGLEALSRGAERAIFFDNEPAALAAVRANIAALKEEARTRIVTGDATRPRPRPAEAPPATLAFFDPPYAGGLAVPALTGFAGEGWLAPGAVCVVEESARGPELVPPPGFAPLVLRRYGAARIVFLRFGGPR